MYVLDMHDERKWDFEQGAELGLYSWGARDRKKYV